MAIVLEPAGGSGKSRFKIFDLSGIVGIVSGEGDGGGSIRVQGRTTTFGVGRFVEGQLQVGGQSHLQGITLQSFFGTIFVGHFGYVITGVLQFFGVVFGTFFGFALGIAFRGSTLKGITLGIRGIGVPGTGTFGAGVTTTGALQGI